MPDAAVGEVQEHLPAIHAMRQLPVELAMAVFDRLRVFIQELPLSFYADQEGRLENTVLDVVKRDRAANARAA